VGVAIGSETDAIMDADYGVSFVKLV